MSLDDHHRATRTVYEENAEAWTNRTIPQHRDLASELMTAMETSADEATGSGVLDLGCGPGWHLPMLGTATTGLDLSLEMLRLAGDRHPQSPLVQADLAALPFARASFGGVWASRTLVHLARHEVPAALADLHRVIAPGGFLAAVIFPGDEELAHSPGDTFPGRYFSYWNPTHAGAVFAAAGFEALSFEATDKLIAVLARRTHTLPDFVGADMNLLICGLNPSPSSADAGVGFFRAGNRFWPAALAAGIVSVDRDPLHALRHHHIGMTDLVKRPTRRADELSADEYRAGAVRVADMAYWLQPDAICMVGLAGWRVAVDRKADRGWQPLLLGDRPVYVMPSTSGLNAHDTVDSLTDHLRNAMDGPPT